MLDAYIIDRLRREQESQESVSMPLRIEIPEDYDDIRHTPDSSPRNDRGMVIIDDDFDTQVD